jgi:hypothetical protein
MLNSVYGSGFGLRKSYCGNQKRPLQRNNNVSFGLSSATLSEAIQQVPAILHPVFISTPEIENFVTAPFCTTLRTNTGLAIEKAFKMKLFKKDGLDFPITAILEDDHILKGGKVQVVLNEAKLIIPPRTLDRYAQLELDVSQIPRLDLQKVSLVFDKKGELIDFNSKGLENVDFAEKQRRLDKVFRAVKATVQTMINYASV